MKVLKFESSLSKEVLVKFINDNKIAREDILIITSAGSSQISETTVFFYGDPDVKQKIAGFWD